MNICEVITNKLVNLEIVVNNGLKNVVYNSNKFNLLDGWQNITIKNIGESFEITDLNINNQSIHENLYTSFVKKKSGKLEQPATFLGDDVESWTIFLHDNIAIYKERICSLFSNGDYGKNLFDDYFLYWDCPIVFKNTFSPQVNNFYAHHWGLNAYKKTNLNIQPYLPLNIAYDHDILWNDIKHITLEKHANDRHHGWYRHLFTDDSGKIITSVENLPVSNIRDWLYSIGISKINRLQVSKLEPGGYIDMHRDNYPQYNSSSTVRYGLYIPIVKHENSYLKFANSGILPNKIASINNMDWVHAAANDSNEDRYVLLLSYEQDVEFLNKYTVNMEIQGYNDTITS
jgi:hypothetical protein